MMVPRTESNHGPIDYSARVQTVKHEDSLIFYDLIKKFMKKLAVLYLLLPLLI